MFSTIPSSSRNSFMALNNVYFWTATINKWYALLAPDVFKEVIISSLRNLTEREKIEVFGFVIMPNHIHLIWRILDMNGKETPQGSLLKYTAHQFKKMILEQTGADGLSPYAVQAANKSFEFWQRDSLAIKLFNRQIAFQKLDYTHRNPLSKRWELADVPEAYRFSSARYYATGVDDFGFLKNLNDVFLLSQF